MKHLLMTAPAAVFLFLLSGAAWADAPNNMAYQGRLEESGALVTGNRTVEIFLCNAATGGTCYSTSAQGVQVEAGLFRSTLAVPSSVDLTTGDWYVEIKVGASTLSPREKLTSSPYALVASSAAFAQTVPDSSVTSSKLAGDAASLSKITESTMTLSPSGLAIQGQNVGIGMTNPGAKLQVNGNIIASTPTISSHVATKGYVDAGAGSRLIAMSHVGEIFASQTHYYPILGAGYSQYRGVEAANQIKMYGTGQFQKLRVYVWFNDLTGSTTVKLRKNGGDANLGVSIPAAATGAFEDLVNTDSYIDGDLLNFQFITAAGGSQIKFAIFQMEQVVP